MPDAPTIDPGTQTPPAAPPSTPPAGDNEPSAFDSFDAHFPEGGSSAPPAQPPPSQPPAQPPATPRQPPAGKPPTAKPTRPAPSARQPQTPPATPPAGTPPAPPQEFDEEEGVQIPKFKSDKDFRGWGLNGYKKANALERELGDIRKKYEEVSQSIPKSQADAQAMAAKLQDLEKRYAEAEDRLRYTNYEQSSEFQDKYQKPYRAAWQAAVADVQQLFVTEEDKTQEPLENGKYPTKERLGTEADFDQIYAAPLGEAVKLAHAKFGTAATYVLHHCRTIRDLAKGANLALKEWKEKGAERTKQEQAAAAEKDANLQAYWFKVNEKFSEDPRAKEWWGEEKDDKEINDALKAGFEYADKKFSEEYDKLPEMERLALDASIRHRVAGFNKMTILVKRLTEKLAKAEADLAAIKGSGPGAPEGGAPAGGEPPQEIDSAMGEFDKRFA